jgi:hypothetical protein
LPGYKVPIVVEPAGSSLVNPDFLLPIAGVTFEVTDQGIVFTVRIDGENAAEARDSAREIIRDVLRVFGASHVAYRMLSAHPDYLVSRTDAVYVEGGEIPPIDSLDSRWTDAGANIFDPTGESRRSGKVFQTHILGEAHHSVSKDVKLLVRRDNWSSNLRASLDLYLAGQCTDNEWVRFILSMATLEELAQPSEDFLLTQRMSEKQRSDFFASAREACENSCLSATEIDTLVRRLAETRAVGSNKTLTSYLNRRSPAAFGNSSSASKKDVGRWQKWRNNYVHGGVMEPDSTPERNRLIALVGVCLRAELVDPVHQLARDWPGETPRLCGYSWRGITTAFKIPFSKLEWGVTFSVTRFCVFIRKRRTPK